MFSALTATCAKQNKNTNLPVKFTVTRVKHIPRLVIHISPLCMTATRKAGLVFSILNRVHHL